MADRRVRPGLNADVGEGSPHDAALLRLLDRASVACGGHAGSNASMRRIVRAAAALGIPVGAHVSYPDRRQFGRVTVTLPVARLEAVLFRQARALMRIATAARLRLEHVKPHGALYHDASRDQGVAGVIGRVIRRLGADVFWLAEPGGIQERTARRMAIPFLREGFADRRYARSGRLVPRTVRGAVLTRPRLVAAQIRRLKRTGRFDAFCVHGDTPGCVGLARAARSALTR